MILNRKFELLLNKNCRYFVITGGRGSSKSYSVTLFSTTLTMEEKIKTLFTRYTMTSARLSIIPEFVEKLELFDWVKFFTINKDEIVNNKNGSSVLFRGLKTSAGNQTANLKSLQGISNWILDEAEELLDEDDFDTIDLSIREKGKQNRIIIIMNPATKEHWIYKKFFLGAGVKEGFNGIKGDTCYVHTTYLDNIENLSESYIKRIKQIKLNNPKKYQHKILGGWLDKAEGVVFTDWEFGTFNPDGLQTSCGMDFGFSIDPDTLTEVAIDKKKKIIYLKELIYQNGLGTFELARIIKSRVDNKLIIADSAEPRLISDLKAQSINIKPVKKGTIESGITRMQDYKIVITPESTNIAKELNNYVYVDKGSKLYIDDWNHAIDGARYNIIYHLDNPNKGNYYIY